MAPWLRASWAMACGLALSVTGIIAVGLPIHPTPASTSADAASPSLAVCPAQATVGHVTCNARVAARAKNGKLVAVHASTPARDWYTPADLHRMYGLYDLAAPTTEGLGQTIAVIEAGDAPSALTDFAAYRAQFGLGASDCAAAVPTGCLTVYNQTGADITAQVGDPGTAGVPAVDSTAWGQETDLDTQSVAAICPLCNVHLYLADSDAGVYPTIATVVAKHEKFVSMSFGGQESPQDLQFDSSYFAKAASTTLFAASTGDAAFGGGTEYPSVSPYVLAVGGASVTRTATGFASTAWSGTSSGGGSGCSKYEPKPAWQDGVVPDSVCTHRAVADISAIADPAHGVAIAVGSRSGHRVWEQLGGTSLATPVVVAMAALDGVPPGDASRNSDPYTNTLAIADVKAGSNGTCASVLLCRAGKGWDGPTGLGTPISPAVLAGQGTSLASVTSVATATREATTKREPAHRHQKHQKRR